MRLLGRCATDELGFYRARKPPSTGRLTPLINALSSERSHLAAFAMSYGMPKRQIECRSLFPDASSDAPTFGLLDSSSIMGVSIIPGRMALTRPPVMPASAAPDRVSPMTACFEAKYSAP